MTSAPASPPKYSAEQLAAWKRQAAQAALSFVEPNTVLGVGTGSTVDHFIALLPSLPHPVRQAVSSSERSTAQLRALGIEVLDLNDVQEIPLYVDGADEVDERGTMIKGGGAALTREKIVAQVAKRFVCVVDISNRVPQLGGFALPVEVVPMARALVSRTLAELGGQAVWRSQVVTDNGMHILDVRGLDYADPLALEANLNQIPGVLTVGLFAWRGADVVLCAGPEGVQTFEHRWEDRAALGGCALPPP